MVLKLGHFGKQNRNTWKVLKCGAGEEWRRLVGRSCKIRSITYSQGREKWHIYNKKKNTISIGHILRKNSLLKDVSESKIEGSIEVTGRRVRRPKQTLDDLKERENNEH
jgi:hypothetical protein